MNPNTRGQLEDLLKSGTISDYGWFAITENLGCLTINFSSGQSLTTLTPVCGKSDE